MQPNKPRRRKNKRKYTTSQYWSQKMVHSRSSYRQSASNGLSKQRTFIPSATTFRNLCVLWVDLAPKIIFLHVARQIYILQWVHCWWILYKELPLFASIFKIFLFVKDTNALHFLKSFSNIASWTLTYIVSNNKYAFMLLYC